jgi:zinc protease
MQWNGTTNTERVNYFFTTTTDHFDDAMVFMRDAIVSPVFDPKELERERVVVTGEIDRNEASPYYYLYRAVNDRVWWKYPSRKDPLGRRKTVLATTVKQMKTIKERYYIPNNSVLVVTGDVKAADVFAKADQLFAAWKPGPDPFKKYPLVKHPPIKKTEVVVVEQKVKTITGEIVWHGPSTVGPTVVDTYPADSLGAYIGEPSSKFQKNLVDAGHCVSAGMFWYTQMNTGPITLNWEATPEKADACVTAIVAELAAMRSPDYASPDDLLRAAHEMEVNFVRETERPSEFAHSVTFWWTSAGIDYMLTYVAALYRVTGADVARYVDTYITGKPYVFAVMMSPEMKAAGLDAAHFEAVLGLAKGAK